MNAPRRRVLVWDLPTRLFHWLTVALVVAAYLTWRWNWMDWHVWIGEALLTLLLFRVAWGLFGSDTARFSRFLGSPKAAAQHLAHLFRREPDQEAGHNPAGGWMVLVMLGLLLGQTLSGLYVNNDIADVGPLTALVPAHVADFINDLHDIFLWDALVAAVALHLAAVLLYRLAKGQNLVAPMISGRKWLAAGIAAPRMARLGRAVLLLGASAAVTALVATYL